MANEKLTMTNIGKINSIEGPYRKLLLGQDLTYEEKSLLLSTAIILLREYENKLKGENERHESLITD